MLLELTSFAATVKADDGSDEEMGPYEFRPDLLCHDEDRGGVCNVRG